MVVTAIAALMIVEYAVDFDRRWMAESVEAPVIYICTIVID